MAKRALVTGGAGLIGSHIVDLLVNEGWQVRAIDNLEPQTHRQGKPAWINKKAEFVHGDLCDRDTIIVALDKIDVVFHQAAYGGLFDGNMEILGLLLCGTGSIIRGDTEE